MILMNIDARDRILQYFAVSNLRGLGGWILLLSAERFDDNLFYFGRRNTGDRSNRCCFGFSVKVRQRNIIALANAGLGRMGRHHAVTGIVEQKSGQQMVTRGPQSGSGGPLIRELLLDRIK